MRGVRHDVPANRARLESGRDLSKRRRDVLACVLLPLAWPARALAQAQDTIERVKRSSVAVGTYLATRSPPFLFRGTGFAVGDGTLIATNAHVLRDTTAADPTMEVTSIVLPSSQPGEASGRTATVVSLDREHDLALLRIGGRPLPPLTLGDSDKVREGDSLLVTGFPLGTILGAFPVTHRVMIAAIAPIVIPQGSARQLDAARVRALQTGAFRIFQLDGSIFPGHSGSPLYHPSTGEVLGVINMAVVRDLREGTSLQPTGIAYAIPARYLAELLGRL
jgi:serine protease Do